LIDTDPRVGGQGLARLQQHNISTEIMDGEESRLCQEINAPFFHRIQTGRPYVTRCSLPANLLTLQPSKYPPQLANQLENVVDDMDTIVLPIDERWNQGEWTTIRLMLERLFPAHMNLLLLSHNYSSSSSEELQTFFSSFTTTRRNTSVVHIPSQEDIKGVLSLLGPVHQSNGLVLIQFRSEEDGNMLERKEVDHDDDGVQRLVTVTVKNNSESSGSSSKEILVTSHSYWTMMTAGCTTATANDSSGGEHNHNHKDEHHYQHNRNSGCDSDEEGGCC